MTATIDPQHAADLYESEDGETAGPWTRVGNQKVRIRRWSTEWYLVVSNEAGEHFGVRYEEGLTENQDIDLPWEDTDKPLPLIRLYPHEVTTTVYRTKPREFQHVPEEASNDVDRD